MNRFRRLLTQLISIPILFSLFLFIHCSSDDGENENEETKFVGTWVIASVDAELTIDGKPLLQILIDEFELTEDEAEILEDFFKKSLEDEIGDGEIELKSDNTYVADFGDDPDTGKWSYNSSTGYLTIDSDDPDEDTQMIKVSSITSNTIILEQEETFDEDLDDDGTDEEIDAKIEMTLAKS